MSKEYNITQNSMGQNVIWYEENGFRVSFLEDPTNADYQAYLNKDTLPSNSSTPQAGA